jgi:hypothetical protein
VTTYLAITEVVDNVKDEFDLWYAVIIGFPGVVAAVLAYYGQQKAKQRWNRQAKQSDEIHYQVKNDHPSNFRDDLDELKRIVQEGFQNIHKSFSEVHVDVSGVREELRTERLERIAGDKNRL